MRTNSSAAANYMDYDSSSSMPGAFDLGREVQRTYEDLVDATSRCGRRAWLRFAQNVWGIRRSRKAVPP